LSATHRYIRRKSVLFVMLGGGDKSTQSADIAKNNHGQLRIYF